MLAHNGEPEHGGKISRYVVQSSDVISDMRVNISEQGSDKVIWYKERFLSDDEIVEHFVENATSTIMWTIHRPKRGWYIRLRAPSFPPGVFIPLLPVPRTAPHYADAALSFVCRTAVTTRTHEPTDSLSPPSSSRTSSESVSTDTTAVHGYPPSPPPPPPPPLVVQPPSPTEFDEKADQHVPQPRPRPRPRIHNQIGEFVMSPNRHPEPPAQSASFFARALSVFKSHAPSHSYSFTLSSLQPRPAQYNLRNLSPTQPQATLSSSAPQPQLSTAVPTAMPLLKFQDQTPALTISSITGLLEVDEVQEKALGVQNTFWIAVALTYLQFLEERESYLAASAD